MISFRPDVYQGSFVLVPGFVLGSAQVDFRVPFLDVSFKPKGVGFGLYGRLVVLHYFRFS